MLSVVCWSWGGRFAPVYVNRLRSMLARQLRLPHQLYCVTDDSTGIDPAVRVVPMPTEFSDTPRCRRRMWQFAKERRSDFGPRMLCIDLDVVIVDDITSLVARPEPIVCWRVGYADVYSGSFMLLDTGALDGAWRGFERNPDGYLKSTGERNGSDQAMINMYLRGQAVATWTEKDGFVTWFGDGYAAKEHHGMGPNRPQLTRGARIVVLGSADKHVMDEGRFDWIREHWR